MLDDLDEEHKQAYEERNDSDYEEIDWHKLSRKGAKTDLPGGDEVYRGGARVNSLEELNAALEAAGVPSAEPPALCRQKAEIEANH